MSAEFEAQFDAAQEIAALRAEVEKFKAAYLEADHAGRVAVDKALDRANGLQTERDTLRAELEKLRAENVILPRQSWDSANQVAASWRERAEAAEAQLAEAQEAVEAILKEPYGCPFCDSGKLRSPDKDHLPNCGFLLAAKFAALAPAAEPAAPKEV